MWELPPVSWRIVTCWCWRRIGRRKHIDVICRRLQDIFQTGVHIAFSLRQSNQPLFWGLLLLRQRLQSDVVNLPLRLSPLVASIASLHRQLLVQMGGISGGLVSHHCHQPRFSWARQGLQIVHRGPETKCRQFPNHRSAF